MLTSSLLLLASAAGFASAAPTSPLLGPQLDLHADLARRAPESDPVLVDVPIHESCNGTQRAQIQRGLEDMKTLARTSIDHILAHGPMDEYFVRYFGEGADPAPVLGYYQEILAGDKTGTLLRCDNPDGNCDLTSWAGHWRGANATQETVICELSYHTRRPLEQICGFGFQLARDNANLYWGADLLHRLFHVPKVTNEKIAHISDSYVDVLELARTNSTGAVANQRSLQYYALDVFSRTVVEDGCVGEPAPETEADTSAATSTAASTSTAAPKIPVAAPNSSEAAAAQAPTPTVAVSQDCHTHVDGSVHCGYH